jgi:hypothetical protein
MSKSDKKKAKEAKAKETKSKEPKAAKTKNAAPKAEKHKKHNDPFFPILTKLPDGTVIARGTTATKAPGPVNPGPNLALRHADIIIPAILVNPTLHVIIYSLSQSPAFVVNNFIYTWDKKNTSIGVDFSNTRENEKGEPLPEPETNILYCDYIVIGSQSK